MMHKMKRPGFGAIEILIIAAVMIVIGGLAYYALAPKPSKTNVQSQTSPSAKAIDSVEEVKTEQTQLEKEDGTEVQTELDALTADLNSL